MAAKTTLNAKNLEALGAVRLAELLIEISTGSAASKRRLRLELAGNHSSIEVSREVRKRLASIARSRTFINWRRVKAVKSDLETQRRTIVENVVPVDAKEAFELIWQFLSLANPVLERSSVSSSYLIECFRDACVDAGSIARSANVKPDVLADRVFAALQANVYGQYDCLISAMVPALGPDGLQRLKAMLTKLGKEFEEELVSLPPRAHGKKSVRPANSNFGRHRMAARKALQEIADAEGDIDAYIDQHPPETRDEAIVAAEIGRRFLAAGRPEDAIKALDRALRAARPEGLLEWELVRADTLEALGRPESAQDFRWSCFEASLKCVHLRAFMSRLPDFDDVEAEEKGFRLAHAFPDVHRALAFFIEWPAPAQAARLILNRRNELDGDLYPEITRTAEALASRYPLAATILLRSMVDFTLDRARSTRYRHAAIHLAECAALSRGISDFGQVGSHETYVAGLRQRHSKKQGFWRHIAV